MPDLILTQARIPMLDTLQPMAKAVAVQNGRIVALGSHDEVMNVRQAHTQVINLNGATLLPGFHDAHCHVLPFGLTLDMVPLAFPSVRSISDVVQRLSDRAAQLSAGPEAWVRGRGYDQNRLTEHRHPTRQELDAVPGDPCVIITHASGHAVAVNSRVLRLAGITCDTPDPAGGTIVRDDQGEPTGVLLENAILLADAILPTPTLAEKVTAIGRASQAMHRMGITSAVDAGTEMDDLPVYRGAAAQGLLTTCCTLMMLWDRLVAGDHVPSPQDLHDASDGDWVRLGPAKLFSDGALTTRTALLRASYIDDPLQHGTAMWSTERLETMVRLAHEADWQIAIHAIGDAAIDLCMDAIGKAQSHRPRSDARHRIEHAMLLWRDQIGRMARLGVLPVFQPEFISRFGDAYIMALGRTRADRLMPYQATMAADMPLVFSSDLPVVPGAPLDGIAAACRRRTPSGEVLNATQAVSVHDALLAYTVGAAYSVFAEQERGSLSIGQRADFVVLNHDPTELPLDEWEDGLSVTATLVGGRVVYGDL